MHSDRSISHPPHSHHSTFSHSPRTLYLTAMSFDINWSQLVEDESINNSIKEFLASQFLSVSLPSYIDNLTVSDFLLGDEAPEIIIRDIGDTFDDFYEDEDGPRNAGAPTTTATSGMGESDSSDDEETRDGLAGEVTLSETTDDPTQLPLHPIPTKLRRSHTTLAAIPIPSHSHLNSLYAYNLTNVGLGTLNLNSVTPSGRDTPTQILNQMRTAGGGPNLPPILASPVSSLKKLKRGENDVQIIAEVKYKGNLHIEVTVDLFLNYPSQHFVTLPIKLHITGFEIHSLICIAYLQNAVYFSFLCDVSDDSQTDYFNGAHMESGGNFVEYVSGTNNKERIDIIKKVKIESEIGEVETNVLRNVGKVEKFLVEKIRSIIREETAWPSWLCIEMSE